MNGKITDSLDGTGYFYEDPVTGVAVLCAGRIRTGEDRAAGPLIVRQYERFGPACASRIEGSFAFAIYDSRSHRSVLARDTAGTVPLYYANTSDGTLVFGTRIEPMLGQLGRPELEPASLLDYLTFLWSLDGKTFFRGITLLPPGSVYVDGYTERYFSFQHTPEQREPVEWQNAIVDTLTEVVREIAKPGIGCHLSGGIDSSVMAALVTRLSGQPPPSFVASFPGYADYDESPYAQLVADNIGSELVRVAVRPESFPDTLTSIIGTLEEPKCHPPVFPRYLVGKSAHNAGCALVVSGRGADELFTGYDSHMADSLQSHRARRTLFDRAQRAHLLRAEFMETTDYDPDRAYDEIFEQTQGNSILERVLAFDFNTFMANWLAIDYKVSRRFDIVPVAPFLDRRVIELALRIPVELKCPDDRPKQLLKNAVAELVPEQIIARRKVGFRTPMGEMFRDGLEPFVRDTLCEDSSCFWDIFAPDGVNSLVEDHFSGTRNFGWQLWALLCTKEWCRLFIDEEVSAQ